VVWLLGQKVKGQGHWVTKCKNILKAIEWPAWVCTSIECQQSIVNTKMYGKISCRTNSFHETQQRDITSIHQQLQLQQQYQKHRWFLDIGHCGSLHSSNKPSVRRPPLNRLWVSVLRHHRNCRGYYYYYYYYCPTTAWHQLDVVVFSVLQLQMHIIATNTPLQSLELIFSFLTVVIGFYSSSFSLISCFDLVW